MSTNPFLTPTFVRVVQAVYGLAAQHQPITAPNVASMTGLTKAAVQRPLGRLELAGYLASQIEPYTDAAGRRRPGVSVRVYTLTDHGRAALRAAVAAS